MASAKRTHVLGLEPWHGASVVPAFTDFTINAANMGCGCGLQSPADLTITELGFRVGTITGNPTLRLSLQGVTTEYPNGTILGATNNGLNTFNPGAGGLAWSNNSWHWLTLAESVALTRGQHVWITLEDSSGVDGSNSITVSNSTAATALVSWFKGATKTASTWSRGTTQMVCMAMKNAGGVIVGQPIDAIASVSITGASSPREVGIKFRLDSNWGSTYTLLGAMMLMTAGTTMEWKLYDGGDAADTTVLQNYSSNAVLPPGGNATTRQRWGRIFDEATLSTLTFGNYYRLALACSSNTCTTYWLDVASAGDMDAYELGQDVQYTYRDSGGNWTDLATRRPFDWTLLLEDITEPSSGGILTHPGMSGGCRG